MIEADAYEQRGGLELRELAGLDFDRVRVLYGRRQTVHADAIASDCLDQRLQICGGGDHGQPTGWGRGDSTPCRQHDERSEREAGGARAQHRYFLTKMDFGIMQCTPLRTSTTWVTRQSPTMETSA